MYIHMPLNPTLIRTTKFSEEIVNSETIQLLEEDAKYKMINKIHKKVMVHRQ